MEWIDRLKTRLMKYNGRETYAFGMIMVGLSLTVLPNHDSIGGTIGYAETFWGVDRNVFAIISFVSAVIILLIRPTGWAYIVLCTPLMLFIFTILKFSLDTHVPLVISFLLVSYLLRIVEDTSKP